MTATKQALLVINSGSSSVKFAAYDVPTPGAAPQRIANGRIEAIGSSPRLLVWGQQGNQLEDRLITLSAEPLQGQSNEQEYAFKQLFDWLGQHADGRTLAAVGHRVVHGGEKFTRPVQVTAGILAELEALSALAPLHQPHNLSAMHAINRLLPGLAQVACFDTEFHIGQPWVAQALALPRHITSKGVKRYGFHGLSYEYIASVLPECLGAAAASRVVVAHLGNGASMCAMKSRKSIASTMGFTALEGLMMGTRCGSLDPGVVLHLIGTLGMTVQAVEKLLYEQSGLLGVSGVSGDMRAVEASTTAEAQQAVELYVYRIHQQLGSLAASLGGLDVLVFTAGIGENSANVRRRVCEGAAWLGVELDDQANQANQAIAAGARRISKPASKVAVWVIPTNEELMIARHTQAVLRGIQPPASNSE